MADWIRTIYRTIPQPHVVAVLMLASAVLLLVFSELVDSEGSLGIAMGSLLGTRRENRKTESDRDHTDPSGETRGKGQLFSSVDELSAGIAHEINNPLGIIAQETQLLEDVLKRASLINVPEREEMSDSLREIAEQVRRCQEIVEKLLSLARHAQPIVQKVNVNELVQEMTRLVEREAAEKSIGIVTGLEFDLPLIDSDSPLLRQVLLNLLVNAIRASRERCVIQITTRSTSGRTIEIAVHDTGCGIRKEHLSKIFTPFFSTRLEGKGAGLGLALCRGIVEKLGGNISVHSEVGRCTTFTVHLPVEWYEKSGERR